MNKNSKEFDQELLNSLIGKKIPISSFEDELQKIFKKKSSRKLWWDNKPTKIWDGKEYHNLTDLHTNRWQVSGQKDVTCGSIHQGSYLPIGKVGLFFDAGSCLL